MNTLAAEVNGTMSSRVGGCHTITLLQHPDIGVVLMRLIKSA